MNFDEIWPTLPKGMRLCGKSKGREKFEKAKARAVKEYGQDASARFLGGLKAYMNGKEDWRNWMHFTTFCNQDIWDVDPDDYENERPMTTYERDAWMDDWRRKNMKVISND